MFKFTRTKKTAGKTFRYVKDDLLNYKEAKGYFDDFKGIAHEHLDPRTKKSSRQETFANAVERLNLSEADIAGSYKTYSTTFYILSFFAGLDLFLMGWLTINYSVWNSLPAIGALLVLVANMFKASFRCFQIRHHELYSVGTWWAAKSEWFPGDYMPPKANRGTRAVSRSTKTRDR